MYSSILILYSLPISVENTHVHVQLHVHVFNFDLTLKIIHSLITTSSYFLNMQSQVDLLH